MERRCGVLRTAWRGAVASELVSTRSESRWWAWVLALALLIGAVLLMHGLAVVAGEHHGATSTAVMSGVGSHAADDLNGHLQATSSSEDGNCLECVVGHVMAACMAVLTVIAGAGLLRYRPFAGRVTVLAAVCDWTGTLVESARSPDPPWVRLSVMRC